MGFDIKEKIFKFYFFKSPRPKYSDMAGEFSLKFSDISLYIKEIRSERAEEIERINRLLFNLYLTKKEKYGNCFKFESFEVFYKWYVEKFENQGGACYYCKTKENDLAKLFEEKKLPNKQYPKRGKHLEVERKNSYRGADNYHESNCVLCCFLCNNAKSDIFNEKQFESIGKTIGKVIKLL
ncbi:MAG: hypothetical protein WC394_04450 [Candidatus Omnitrophota bacterium]|jgi:hypothetical protein